MKANDKVYKNLLSKRRRKNIKRKFFIFLKIFFIVIFFIGAVWLINYFYNSQYFKIKNIIINGNTKYDESIIKQKAEIMLGLNIFEINKKYIEDKLIDELVWLKSVNLKKIFPDKVIIEVIERKPFAIISYGNNNFIIDDEGIVLEKVENKTVKDGSVKENTNMYLDLVLVKNAIKSEPEIGEKIANSAILGCGSIYQNLGHDLKNLINYAYLSDDFTENIIFVTKSDKKIVFGTSKDIDRKIQILSLILYKIKKENIYYQLIDLRDIKNPLVK